MIEDTMLEAANTMKAAADEIVRLRRERDELTKRMDDIFHFAVEGAGADPLGTIFRIAKQALGKQEMPS